MTIQINFMIVDRQSPFQNKAKKQQQFLNIKCCETNEVFPVTAFDNVVDDIKLINDNVDQITGEFNLITAYNSRFASLYLNLNKVIKDTNTN